MVDVDLLDQLIKSKEEAVKRLEAAVLSNDMNYVNKLRVFIFQVYQQIDKALNDLSKDEGAQDV
jgi:hypothetical protein